MPIALVVDDNAINCAVAAAILKKRGWQSLTTLSGQQALDLLAESKFDLVLLDISMPDISGIDICRKIKGGLAPDIPVVAYTAHALPDERTAFEKEGFDDLLIKPVTMESFSAMLANLKL